MNTTLNKLRAAKPCADGWAKLLAGLGKTQADDEPLSLVTVLDIDGLEYATWALRCIDDQAQVRRYAVWCARQVQHLMTDPRSLAALDVAERYADGQATKAELAEAGNAAWDAAMAARDAAEAAWDATMAAWAATWIDSWAAAEEAILDAASDAAWDAGRAAASDAQAAQFRIMFGGDK